MRATVLGLALVAGCGFKHGALSGSDGGMLETDALELPPGEHWVFESAGDFAGMGADLRSVTVEPRGALTLDGYIYGGLLMFGKQDVQLWNTTSPTYDYSQTATLTPDGVGLWDTSYVDTNRDFSNAGVTDTTVFTIWFEGEVYLDANDLLTLDADGAGMVELRMGRDFQQVLLGKSDGTHVTTTPIVNAGWYEVRLGWGEGAHNGHFDFRRGPSGGATHFERHRLRAVASRLSGTMRSVFARQILGGGLADSALPVPSLETSALMATQTFPTQLFGATSTDDWSARWYGQFYAAMAGVYRLQVVSDDGNEGLFGSMPFTSHWARNDNTSAALSSPQATLTEGWNDLIVDYNQTAGGRTFTVQLMESPDPTLVGAALPVALLRPVEPRADRFVSRTAKFTPITVTNNVVAGASRDVGLDGFPTEQVTTIDVTVHVTTDHLDQLVFSLTRPGGGKVTLANHPTGAAFSGYVQITSKAMNLTGQSPTGTWTFTLADDTGGGNNTSYDEVAITVHTANGPAQIATRGSWTSPVHDAGKAPVHVIDVVWSERAAMASQIFVRGCAMADCSDDPAWSDPLAQHGTAELANRYMQMKVGMLSDGTTEPELETLAVTYQTDASP